VGSSSMPKNRARPGMGLNKKIKLLQGHKRQTRRTSVGGGRERTRSETEPLYKGLTRNHSIGRGVRFGKGKGQEGIPKNAPERAEKKNKEYKKIFLESTPAQGGRRLRRAREGRARGKRPTAKYSLIPRGGPMGWP